MLLGFFFEFFHFLVAQTGRRFYDYVLRFSRGFVRCGDFENTVSVYVKFHLYLRHASRSRRYAGKLKLAERLVVFGHGTLSLQDMHRHRRLIAGGG